MPRSTTSSSKPSPKRRSSSTSRPVKKTAGKRTGAKPTASTTATTRRNGTRAAAPRPRAGTRSASGVIRTYRSAMSFLRSTINFEQTPPSAAMRQDFNLETMGKLLTALQHPERKFKSVHVAGTKGKGSTATMVANMLQNCGYKVGLYTSPHLISVRERMTVNGEQPDEREFVKMLSRVAVASGRLSRRQMDPTFFDIITATAFTWFAEKGVDIAVVEAGLGGRLDSTNVIAPEVCAITSISYDHTSILGDTLPQIAREKAGIIKRDVPVVSAPQESEVIDVLRGVAGECAAPLCVPIEDHDFSYRFESSRAVGPHTRLSLTTPRSRFEHLHVPLPGEHQALNCSVALGVMDMLKTRGVEIDDQLAIEGLANTRMDGRMEFVHDTPRVLVDGAHNAASVEALMRAIGQTVQYDSMIVIFACQRDKDIHGMLRHVQLGADKIIFTSNNMARGADPVDLLHLFQEKCSKMAQVAETLEEALEIANSAITREDLICITGSFYIAGQAKRLFEQRALAAAAEAAN